MPFTTFAARRRRRTRYIAAIAVTSVGLLSACSAGTGSTSTATTLTFAASGAPASLNPVISDNGPDDIVYQGLAYASLIGRDASGKLSPDLATSWGYVAGHPGTEFSVTLRSGLKFADGEDLDAKAVANSLNYFIKNTSGPSTGAVKGLSATAEGTDKVLISSSTPNPIIDQLLTPYNYLGNIISPKGLANPAELKTQTEGAGPYVYDAAQSVAGDHYTYTANPHYYNAQKITAKTFTVKVIASASSALAALRSGQVDMAYGEQSLVSTAKSYGITVSAAPHSFAGFMIADFGGNLVPALGDEKVRQALNYAIDRSSVAAAAVGEYGKATTQPSLPGWDAYSSELENSYTYDPTKAKRLLQEAGYGQGFTFKVGYAAWEPIDVKVVQAMAEQLAKVGVTVDLVSEASGSQLFGDLAAKKFSAFSLTWGGQTFAANYGSLWAPDAANNVWKNQVDGLAAAYATYQSSMDATHDSAAQAAQKVVVDQALTVPAVQADAIAFSDSKVEGFALDPFGVLTNVSSWTNK